MHKEITLNNLNDLKIKKEDWKDIIEKFVKDAIKHEAKVVSDGVTVEIIDKGNTLNLFYIMYDQNITVYSGKGKPLGAFPIAISYDKILQVIAEG